MEVKPFKAFRYDSHKVGNVGDCIAPPYDVIDSTEQEQLYNKSPYNIVRITRGKVYPEDNTQENQYSRAAAYLSDWSNSGILKKDDRETIYGYVQDFVIGAQSLQRLSFISLAKLEEFGTVVKAHEQTFEKPMTDRLKLKKATLAHFGLVFMLYDDPQCIAESIIRKAMHQEALLDFSDDQAVRHRLFAITSKEDHAAIIAMMADKTCIIADGHHRYTTGLKLSKELSHPNAKYQMISFANIRQQGLLVLATHRLVYNIPGFDGCSLIDKIRGEFDITPFAFKGLAQKQTAKQQMLTMMKTQLNQGRNAFGIYHRGQHCFWVATLKDKESMNTAVPDKSPAWRCLDVAVLHKLIIERQLGIDEEKLAKGQYIVFVKDTPSAVDDSIKQVDSGDKQIAFFVNPITFQQLFDVTEYNERMPQKSTYFYPKMYTGLTIQKL